MSLTAGDAVFTGDRRQHRLGPLLKSGGAGSVYPLLHQPSLVAKIYHDAIDHAEHERKVAAMLYLCPNLPDLVDRGRRYTQIAWPQSLIRDADGRFVGFLMPAIDVEATSELECILQERQARAAGLPTGLGAKITLAANLAAVVAELHRQGHHVVDLKPVNVRFYKHTLYMAVLDCDGFSIQGQGERFLAHQVTPDYIAPEFQGKPIAADLEEQQDRFALAVMVFQLLNFGIHPFTGRPLDERVSTDIPGRIAQRCYAYGLRANAAMLPSPVSGHLAMPADLRALFDRAFESSPAARPSASEWALALRTYAQRANQQLVPCGRDRNHQHFAGLPCAACARAAMIANTARSIEVAKGAAALQRSEAARAKASLSRSPSRAPAPRGVRQSRHGSAASRPAGLPPSRLPSSRGPLPIPSPLFRNRSAGNATAVRVTFAVAMVLVAIVNSLGPSRIAAPAPMSPAMHPTAQAPASADPAAQASTASRPRPASVQEATYTLLVDATSGDATRFASSLESLRRQAGLTAQQRKEYQQEFERGVIALQDRDRNNANYWFMRAIEDDPNQSQAWYGMAVAAPDDGGAIGALVIADYLQNGAITRTAMHQEFPSQMLVLLGIDPGRFEMLKARAQAIVASMRGLPLAPDVASMAREPLPPKSP